MTGITNGEGQVYQSYRYGSFGEITFGAPQYENEYTYNGESYNPNIESQYLRARYYNVIHANFLTEDSYLGNIYEPLTLNRYNYCVSNPVNYRDPSGNKAIFDAIKDWFAKLFGWNKETENPATVESEVNTATTENSNEIVQNSTQNKADSTETYIEDVQQEAEDNSTIVDCEPLENELCYAINGTAEDRLSEDQIDANAKYIYNYLKGAGWTIQAVSGLFGNISQESGFNPGSWQVQDKSSQGYGLVQWTSVEKKFFTWMQDEKGIEMLTSKEDDSEECVGVDVVNNMAENDATQLMDYELEYFVWSCQGSIPTDKREWFATNGYDSPYKMSYDEYIQSEYGAGELALVFHASYERSADDAEQRTERINDAETWYDKLLEFENEQ